MCRRCLTPGSRSGSFCSEASTLVDSRRTSDVSLTTTVAERQEEVSFKVLAEEEGSSMWLTVPAGQSALKRVGSASSFGSTSTVISAFTAADCARSLHACLPEKIRMTSRNASGVAISCWKIETGYGMGESENMHWRMYDNGRYERT